MTTDNITCICYNISLSVVWQGISLPIKRLFAKSNGTWFSFRVASWSSSFIRNSLVVHSLWLLIVYSICSIYRWTRIDWLRLMIDLMGLDLSWPLVLLLVLARLRIGLGQSVCDWLESVTEWVNHSISDTNESLTFTTTSYTRARLRVIRSVSE